MSIKLMGSAALLSMACLSGQAMAASAAAASVARMDAVEDLAPVASPVPCVRGFSKDACAGEFGSGHADITQCPISSVPCDTVTVTGQKWQFALRSNTEACSTTGPTPIRCDEVKDGRIEALVDYVMRLNDPCKYRGCIEGEATYYSDTGAVFAGRIMGTMGAGTDRRPRCPVLPSDPPFLPAGCERCWDVELQVGQTVKLWRVGVDASFHGTRIDADTGEEVCITLSGDFYAPGDGSGISSFVTGWRYYGTADGIYTFLCGVITP